MSVGSGKGRCVLLLFGLLLMALSWLFSGIAQAANPACQRSEPDSGEYSIQVCIEQPENGSRVSGDIAVTTTIERGAGAPQPRWLTFFLDDKYLISDYEPPYTFVLPTDQFSDGIHRLEVNLVMDNDLVLDGGKIGLEIQNGSLAAAPTHAAIELPPEMDRAGDTAPLIVAAVGDGATGYATADQVVELIEGWNPELFLYLGDVYREGSLVEFYNWYEPSFGRLRAITYPTIGNHEYRINGGEAYFEFWEGIPSYYSFDVAGWHIVSLNSNCRRVGGCDMDSLQYRWLRHDLEQPARCTLVYTHYPVFVSDPDDDMPLLDAFWPLFVREQVTMVLTAHDHTYQRWQPLDEEGEPNKEGPTQIVVGTGGQRLYDLDSDDARLVEGIDDSYGALRLELHPDQAHLQFIDVAGKVLDESTIQCRGPEAPGIVASQLAPATSLDAQVTPTATLTGGVDTAIFDFDSSQPAETGDRAPLGILAALVLLTTASLAIVVRRALGPSTGAAQEQGSDERTAG